MAKSRQFAAFLAIMSVLIGFWQQSLAQSSYYEEVQRTFYGGLVAGANFTQIDGDNFAGYHKAGINVGGRVYAHLAPKVAASIEILFSQKGSRAHQAQLSNIHNSQQYLIHKYNIDLNYAEVPVMINYFDRDKAHIGVGLSYSQLINSREFVVTDRPFTPGVDLNEDYPFKKFDLNWLIGGSIHLWKGIFLDVRFQYSLIPIRTKIDPYLGRADQYSNMYVLRLMYLFGTEQKY
jgi:hypothetical protein